NLVDLEVPEQRLRVLHIEARSELRAERGGETGGRYTAVIPSGLVSAPPWERLVDGHLVREDAVDDALAAPRERAGRLKRLRGSIEARAQVGRPKRPGLRDAHIRKLGVEPLDADAEILLQRQLDGVIDRQHA